MTDLLVHGAHPFPSDIEALLREVLELDPGFPDGKRSYLDQIAWDQRFRDWQAGKNLNEGRQALVEVLKELRDKR